MSKSSKSPTLSQALNSGVRKYGSAIVANLAIALRTSQLFGFSHQNVVKAIADLREYVTSFIALEGDTEISRIDEFLFINEVRLKVDLGGIQTYNHVVACMKERGIGALTFREGLTEDELRSFLEILNRPVPTDAGDPWKVIAPRFEEASLPSIEVAKYTEQKRVQQDFSEDRRMLASSVYFTTIQLMDEALEQIRGDKKLNLKRLKRCIQSMVDLILDEQSTLLALVNIKDYGSMLASHATNVAVLSVALGSRLGFAKKHLGDLGVAALFHDIGKFRLPEELATSPPGALAPDDAARLREHVYAGVDTLLAQRISDAVVKSMNVAFMHHFRYDGTGYPEAVVVKEQNVYSRLIAIADAYDNWSRRADDGTAPLPPDRILRTFMDHGGTEFDPLAVKAFTHILGLYPVGCIVCLDTGELGSVTAASENPRYLDRPRVRLFKDASGGPLDETVDLMERGPDGRFRRSLLKLFQQEEIQLELDEFLCVI